MYDNFWGGLLERNILYATKNVYKNSFLYYVILGGQY